MFNKPAMATIVMRFDLRVPPFGTASHRELYAACLEQCAWADAQGLDMVVLSEHHGVDDGYLPAPLTLAAAIAGRTARIGINVAAILVPLHDPVRLAEQLAVLDLASGSRVSLVAGLGYRDEELQMAGIERRERGKLLEEGIEVLRQAWTGEPFAWRGRTVRVTPRPASPPMILIGGSTPPAARRAARLRCGFFPAVGDPDLARLYQAECARLGFQGFVSLPGGPGFVHVSTDPEPDWARIAPHALYDAQTYDSWQPAGQRSAVHTAARDADQLRRSGVYRVLTPAETIALARDTGRLVLHPLMGGIPPALAWESLRLVEREVLPALRG
jgi:alkanesulfonate monooxygenase SsuD/methylene tetrahydromethanopterin reductase-like flavin-dependent oxidoreductase (luciferase family)